MGWRQLLANVTPERTTLHLFGVIGTDLEAFGFAEVGIFGNSSLIGVLIILTVLDATCGCFLVPLLA